MVEHATLNLELERTGSLMPSPLETLIAKWETSLSVHLQNAGRQRDQGFPELADESRRRAEMSELVVEQLKTLLPALVPPPETQEQGQGAICINCGAAG